MLVSVEHLVIEVASETVWVVFEAAWVASETAWVVFETVWVGPAEKRSWEKSEEHSDAWVADL